MNKQPLKSLTSQEPKVIVKIHGGLGNQLFQYSYARALADRYNATLKLDVSSYTPKMASKDNPDHVFRRRYGLGKMQIVADEATECEIIELRGSRNLFQRLLTKFDPICRRYVEEKCFHFDLRYLAPEQLKKGRSVYVHGFWQTEKYFEEIREKLLSELTVASCPDASNAQLLDEITAVNSVCVHVRRGNFLLKHYKDYHGVCSIDYYRQAVSKICTQVKAPRFYIFSDDHEWVKDKMNFLSPATQVTLNGPENDYDDLRLMSRCKHHVIANSSFSWWGAWLSTHETKLVIAPSKIFRLSKLNTDDFAPESWIKITTSFV